MGFMRWDARRGRPFSAGFAVVAGMLSSLASSAPGGTPEGLVDPPTFTKDVAPILNKHCRSCHRRGQVGPFPLETYEQARKRADDIAATVEGRHMPPWKAKPGVGPKLKFDGSLPPSAIATLLAWAKAGAPRGDDSAMPTAPPHPPAGSEDGWALGTPDLVVEMTESFTVPADGPDLSRCFVIPTKLPDDVYVSAVEFRPGNPRVVHHMMAFVETAGEGRKRDRGEAGPGYASFSGAGVPVQGDLGGWAAGNHPKRLPDGIGRLLPSKADVILLIHYHPSGKVERDRSKIGLHLCRTPVKQTLHWNGASNLEFRLPAGHSKVEVRASWHVPVDVDALGVTPHMHHLGRDMTMSVTFPGGLTEDLIAIRDWDPGWQHTYDFEKPMYIPKGSVVKVVAHFDNSSDNPRNPHRPPKLVTWGEGANDEMCIGYIAVVKNGQDLTRPGEKDDLFDIFVKQRQDGRGRRLRAGRGR